MYFYPSRHAHQMSKSNPLPPPPLRFPKFCTHMKYGRLCVQVWAQTDVLKGSDTNKIKMDALVYQSHAKTLFWARWYQHLINENWCASYFRISWWDLWSYLHFPSQMKMGVLLDKIFEKSYSELGNILQYNSNKYKYSRQSKLRQKANRRSLGPHSFKNGWVQLNISTLEKIFKTNIFV